MSGFTTVAKVSELPPGKMLVVSVAEERVVLCNVDGKIFAVEDRCSHDDGTLSDGELIGAEIECPRHGARFDVKTGAVTCPPAVRPIRHFQVQIDGDAVQIAAVHQD